MSKLIGKKFLDGFLGMDEVKRDGDGSIF